MPIRIEHVGDVAVVMPSTQGAENSRSRCHGGENPWAYTAVDSTEVVSVSVHGDRQPVMRAPPEDPGTRGVYATWLQE